MTPPPDGLPELPEPFAFHPERGTSYGYTADQMRAFYQQGREDERAQPCAAPATGVSEEMVTAFIDCQPFATSMNDGTPDFIFIELLLRHYALQQEGTPRGEFTVPAIVEQAEKLSDWNVARAMLAAAPEAET